MNTTTYPITAYHDASGQGGGLQSQHHGLPRHGFRRPPEMPANSTLLADQDDDGDGSEDELERLCGTDSKNASSPPRTELASTCTCGSTSGQRTRVQAADGSSFRSSPRSRSSHSGWPERREEEDVVVATSETPTASAPDSTETLDPVIEGERNQGDPRPCRRRMSQWPGC